MMLSTKSSWALGLRHRATRALCLFGLTATVIGAAALSSAPAAAAARAKQAASAATSSNSAYTAQPPNRILDTRATAQTLTAGSSLNLTVAGGTTTVPSSATAVVLNVTVTDTTAASFLSVYPAGGTRPLVSNLNWTAGETRPNLVEVPVGASGQVTIFNAAGSTDVVVDEEGFFGASSTTAGQYVPLSPTRLYDTRNTTGATPLQAGSTVILKVTAAGGVPSSGVSAVVLNVTVTNTTAGSYLTVYPTGTSRPTASNLNWVAGWTVPNRVIVPVGTAGDVSFFNAAGSTDLVVDVNGYFTDSTASGKLFTPIAPIRITDTRASAQTLGPQGVLTVQVAGVGGVPSAATAAVLNVTVTDTTAASYLTVYPCNTRPVASDLNWVAGKTIPNLVVATLSASGQTCIFNAAGSTDVVVDVFGAFGGAAAGASVSVVANPSSIPADGKPTTTSTVTATVTRADGTLGANDPVNFSLSGAACGSVAPNPVTTGVGGQATTTYTQPATPTIGTCTITATEANGGLSGSATVTQTAVPNTVTGPSPAPKVPADGLSQVTVTFTVKNGVSGAFAVGDTVTFASSGGAACGVLSGSTSPTSATGQVSITYTATTTIGFCTITATDTTAGGSGTSQVTQTSNPPPLANVVAVTANPTHAPADGTSTSTVTATVTKNAGGAATNDPVQFSSNCGTFSPVLVNTNASGVATSTYTTSTTAGACTITATEAQSGTATNLPFTQDVVANKIAATANPSTIPADGTSTSTVTATVTAGVGGAPVSGEPVQFTQGAAPCSSPGAIVTMNTNASGQATLTYKASATTGFCTITVKDNGAVASGGGASTTVTIRQTSGAPASITVTANPASIPADGKPTTTSTVTAVVNNSGGTGVNGDPVNFSLSGAACGTVAPNPMNTSGNGSATTTYTQPATPTIGTCTITAIEANGGLSNSATVTQTAVPNTVTGPSPAPKVAADGASQVTVTFTVKNGISGALVTGDTVTFASSGGAACGVLSGSTSPTSAGLVSITYTATTTVGFCTITATDTTAGGSGTSQVTQTSNPPPTLANVVAVTANPTHAPADGTSTSTVAATVTKGAGGAAINDPVQFSSNCGTFSPILVNTNASGVATSTYTTSTTAGACTITATEAQSGTATPLAFTQDVVPNKIAGTANPSSIPADGVSTSTVTATVTAGAGGAPISGEPVLFTQGAAPCSSPGATVTVNTNASGQASLTYTSSIATGFCTITVKDNGVVASGGGASTTVSIRQF